MNHYLKNLIRSFVLLFILAFPADIMGQDYGYLRIEVDSTGLPVFIDGTFIQMSPIEDVLALNPGFHEVSIIPEEMNTPLLRSRLNDAVAKIFVPENDTIEVILRSVDFNDQIDALRGESILSQYIGWFMIGIVLYLTFSITG